MQKSLIVMLLRSKQSKNNGKYLKNIENNNLDIKPVIKFLSSDKIRQKQNFSNSMVIMVRIHSLKIGTLLYQR